MCHEKRNGQTTSATSHIARQAKKTSRIFGLAKSFSVLVLTISLLLPYVSCTKTFADHRASVRVTTSTGSVASGFIAFRKEGNPYKYLVVTAEHVIRGAQWAQAVTLDGVTLTRAPFEKIWKDKDGYDLGAFVGTSANRLSVANAGSQPRSGSPIAISGFGGNAQYRSVRASWGAAGWQQDQRTGKWEHHRTVNGRAPRFGDSGGAVFDQSYGVVGVVNAREKRNDLGYMADYEPTRKFVARVLQLNGW